MASDALYLPYKVTVSPSSALHPIFGLFYPHKRRHTLCQIRLSPLSLSLGRHGPGQLPNSPHSTVFTGSSRIQAKALSPRSILLGHLTASRIYPLPSGMAPPILRIRRILRMGFSSRDRPFREYVGVLKTLRSENACLIPEWPIPERSTILGTVRRPKNARAFRERPADSQNNPAISRVIHSRMTLHSGNGSQI